MTQTRSTKYTNAVKAFVAEAGHATNAQILQHLQYAYADLSATTVHRITTRMVARGELSQAPADHDNAARFDANIMPHDHFQCLQCDCLRDVELPAELFKTLQEKMGDCRLSGRLNIQGVCAKCLELKEEV